MLEVGGRMSEVKSRRSAVNYKDNNVLFKATFLQLKFWLQTSDYNFFSIFYAIVKNAASILKT